MRRFGRAAPFRTTRGTASTTAGRGVRWLAVVFTMLCAAGPVPAGTEASSQPMRRLAAEAERQIRAYEASSRAVVGAVIVDLADGRELLAHRADRPLVPASNQKILTSAFALAELGCDFEFTTSLAFRDGALWVIGSGDPLLGDPVLAAQSGGGIYDELDRWARAAADANLGRIEKLVLSGAFTPQQPRPQTAFRPGSWPQRFHRKWYGAPVAALNYHNNCYDVTFGKHNGRVEPVVTPASRFLQVVDELRAGKKHLWSLSPDASTGRVTLKGFAARPSSEPFSVACDHPPLLLGRVLAGRLARAGVEADGPMEFRQAPVEDAPPPEAVLCTTRTPLEAVLRRMNKSSLNMAAESVFLRAGDGTFEGSAAAMRRCLVEDYGLEAEGLEILDGSGLSRGNRISARQLARLLSRLIRSRCGAVMGRSMAFSGIDGTLDDRLGEADCRGRIVAKTGYISGVRALSGYVLDERHVPRLVFVTLINNIRGGGSKELQDRLCRRMVRAVDAGALPRPPAAP